MSDVLVAVPSEILDELRKMMPGIEIWGDGRAGNLKKFLNRVMSEMMYDEAVHIITKIKRIEYETRCPYPAHGHGTFFNEETGEWFHGIQKKVL